MNDLRLQLHNITEHSNIAKHISLVGKLKDIFDHNIKLIRKAPGTNEGYNCYMYALGCTEDNEVVNLWRQNSIPNNASISYLVKKGLLIPEEGGKIIIYFDGVKPVHAAKLIDDNRVSSKWGSGHIWEHEIFEVPCDYGDRYEQFRISNKQNMIVALKSFAKH